MPLVHFATHGTLDAETPLNSTVALAQHDELTVHELMSLRLDARLVVLSACGTGQGESTGGDDLLGLTRGLLAAGAQAALVTLWPVDDHAPVRCSCRSSTRGCAAGCRRVRHCSVRSITCGSWRPTRSRHAHAAHIDGCGTP